MSITITSANPAVKAIITGQAPRPARLAAARGLLPLPQADLLEVMVALSHDEDEELALAARSTLKEQPADALTAVAQEAAVAPAVLGYLAGRLDLPDAVYETVVLNVNTPDDAVALLARQTKSSTLLELLIINQQRLLRAPTIMDAVLVNPACPSEAERRVRELQEEFFQKERGAQRIADELRLRGKKAAAEFVESVLTFEEAIIVPLEEVDESEVLTTDDLWLLAEFVEVDDEDLDDSWLAWDMLEELEETSEQRAAMAARIKGEMEAEGEGDENISMAQRILRLGIKGRVKLAMKGNREARSILIRDSNKIVSGSVIRNPRITEQEVESIAAMRSVADEALRLIGMNRAWARHYPIIHNLARNPRTPIAIAMGILPRLQQGDLKKISINRNVPESVRRQAVRLAQARGPR